MQKLQGDMPKIIEAIIQMDVDCTALVRTPGHLGRSATCIPTLKPDTP
ncbi:MAG: hypothetical protein HY234_04945 [Acidobacteria bacterium]|nr:hypothetical protein [Acidobacteriota bacterium]